MTGKGIKLLCCAAAAAVLMAAAPLVGRPCYSPKVYLQACDPSAIADPQSEEAVRAAIFRYERLPKCWSAFIAGAALSLSGLMLQTLFRNALASPYTLGIASGAAFGATGWFLLAPAAIGTVLGLPAAAWASAAGALGAALILLSLARVRGLGTASLPLAGIALSFFFSSLVLAMQYGADAGQMLRMIRWTMGRIEPLSPSMTCVSGLMVVSAAAVHWFYGRELDILTTGKNRALTLGVSVDRLSLLLLLLSSLLVGWTVSLFGPIGFVGLMVPHICRLLYGTRHRVLVPAVFLTGGLFLTGCHTLSRCLLAGDVLPVGVITSLLGGPFFLWILLRRPRYLERGEL
ncbi:MAG: iron ABC transporter permease [Thermoguttaceae bacterium]|nr:iron ABC transporter permease [Thermoguttaceae bacterium]